MKLLYRFEKLEDSRIKTIQEGQLWLSSPNRFNDLDDSRLRGIVNLDIDNEEFRCILNAFDLIQGLDKFKHPFDIGLLKSLKEYINPNSQTHALSKSLHDEAFINKLRDFLKTYFGICCFFSDNIANPLMWAHYADNHKGFCVEYEYDENKDVAEKIHEVVYASQLPIFTARELLFTPEESATRILTTKSLIWHYEKEWRFILPNQTGRPIFLPSNMIVSKIIYGNRCKPENIEKLNTLAETLNIDISPYKSIN